jgi:ABC-type branched-subunit amino acid transport system permease subunit
MGALAAIIFTLIIGFPTFRLKGAYFTAGRLAIAEITRIVVGNALPSISTLPAKYIAIYSLGPCHYIAVTIVAAAVARVYILNN